MELSSESGMCLEMILQPKSDFKQTPPNVLVMSIDIFSLSLSLSLSEIGRQMFSFYSHLTCI